MVTKTRGVLAAAFERLNAFRNGQRAEDVDAVREAAGIIGAGKELNEDQNASFAIGCDVLQLDAEQVQALIAVAEKVHRLTADAAEAKKRIPANEAEYAKAAGKIEKLRAELLEAQQHERNLRAQSQSLAFAGVTLSQTRAACPILYGSHDEAFAAIKEAADARVAQLAVEANKELVKI
jgi:hypothetical protein